MVKRFIKKGVFFWLVLTSLTVFMVAVLGQKNNAVLAQEKPVITCPLEKEVPSGQIADQTQATSNKILQALEDSANAALGSMRAGKKTIELIESCQTENCESSCQLKDVPVACPGTPTTSCTNGYTCAYQSYFHTGQEIIDNSFSRQDCGHLTNDLSINAEKIYAIFKWQEVAGAQCNPHPCLDPDFRPDDPSNCSVGNTCDYQGYTHTGQEIIDNSFSRQECTNLPNDLSIDPTADYAIYQWSSIADGGWCNVEWPKTTCYDTCHDEGWCNVDWTCTNHICQTQDCGGSACNFPEIDAQQDIVSSAEQTTKTSYQTVYDTLHKKVAKLPLLGNVCEIPGLGILCSLCSVLGNVISGCKTELETILALMERGIINARWCWNDPANYQKIITGEKSGKFLLRCQELTPGILEECYPDNYYCCY